MSIHFISGKPGGGKSLYAVRKIVDELVLTDRHIITNLSLRLDRLNEYMQEKYPEKDCDVLHRVRVLNDEETGRFWCYRAHGYRVEDAKERLDFTACYHEDDPKPLKAASELPGVLYVIDEIHNFFNARAWMQTGKAALFYLSQHRKLGDDVICVTQSINNVDKQFRSVAQDFTYLRNFGKEKSFWGLFRSLPMFFRSTYSSPVNGMPGEKPMEIGSFRLDVSGLASCYDTAAGVGILGRSADTGQKTGGLSMKWLIPGGIVAVFLLINAPGFVGKATAGWLGSADEQTVRSVETSGKDEGVKPGASRWMREVRAHDRGGAEDEARDQEEKDEEKVYVIGRFLIGGQMRVDLSDGRSYTEEDAELRFVGKRYVVIGDTRYENPPPGWKPNWNKRKAFQGSRLQTNVR